MLHQYCDIFKGAGEIQFFFLKLRFVVTRSCVKEFLNQLVIYRLQCITQIYWKLYLLKSSGFHFIWLLLWFLFVSTNKCFHRAILSFSKACSNFPVYTLSIMEKKCLKTFAYYLSAHLNYTILQLKNLHFNSTNKKLFYFL